LGEEGSHLNPRFVSLSGAGIGQTWPVREETFSIGRHDKSDLQILQLTVSRDHCVVRCRGGRFRVQDLDSRHGTFVNGLPVCEHQLEHSDLLTVGETQLLFLLDSSSQDAPKARDQGQFLARSTVEKKPSEALYLHPKNKGLPEPARTARDLRAVLELGKAIQALRRSDQLAECFLDAVFHVLPAERAIVLLKEPESEELSTAAVRDLQSGRPFLPSRSAVDRVLQHKVALLCDDIEEDEALRDADSVRTAATVSLLAVPLLGREEVLGVLYCDTSDRRNGFTEHNLDLLTAMAGIASLAFENIRHLEWLQRLRRLEAEPRKHDLVGESPPMKRLFEFISQVAKANSTVLIRGESGTGKELTARAIHQASPRVDAPFLAINCATLSETLLESDLFGHEKGAFTGAVARRIGKLEAAHTGTLFLDEVAEIAPTLQAKLLRVLQEREFERVGGTRPIRVDVRLLAATNRDLEAAIREGKFREDLYYRLDVISVVLPPLRQRREDIPLLASYFAQRHARRLQGGVVGFSAEARRALTAYHWPGNVRQLSNVIERALVLGQDGLIRPEDLPDEVLESGENPSGGDLLSDFQTTIIETKKRLILAAFHTSGGDHQEAARTLGLHVNSLHRLIRNLGLKSRLGKPGPIPGR
jgi:Nif-specific regulatory protein